MDGRADGNQKKHRGLPEPNFDAVCFHRSTGFVARDPPNLREIDLIQLTGCHEDRVALETSIDSIDNVIGKLFKENICNTSA